MVTAHSCQRQAVTENREPTPCQLISEPLQYLPRITLLMSTSMTNEQHRAWMAQWRRAAVALEQVQRRELARMTDAEALAAAERVLTPVGDPYRDPQRLHTSGLVDQQRIFHRRSS